MYDTMKVMKYNINDINRYEVRCHDMMSVHNYYSYRVYMWNNYKQKNIV